MTDEQTLDDRHDPDIDPWAMILWSYVTDHSVHIIGTTPKDAPEIPDTPYSVAVVDIHDQRAFVHVPSTVGSDAPYDHIVLDRRDMDWLLDMQMYGVWSGTVTDVVPVGGDPT